jgi:hypothetical protein
LKLSFSLLSFAFPFHVPESVGRDPVADRDRHGRSPLLGCVNNVSKNVAPLCIINVADVNKFRWEKRSWRIERTFSLISS